MRPKLTLLLLLLGSHASTRAGCCRAPDVSGGDALRVPAPLPPALRVTLGRLRGGSGDDRPSASGERDGSSKRGHTRGRRVAAGTDTQSGAPSSAAGAPRPPKGRGRRKNTAGADKGHDDAGAPPVPPARQSPAAADEDAPAVTHRPLEPDRIAALRAAIQEAPASAGALWSREVESEDWVQAGVMPPPDSDSIRIDSRGVDLGDGEGFSRGGLWGAELGGGGAEGELTKEWAEKMARVFKKRGDAASADAGARGEESDVSEGPISSFGGRKRVLAVDVGASDREGAGSETWREGLDACKAREDEHLPSADQGSVQSRSPHGPKCHKCTIMM